jgi:ribosomal protein S19E (S16A)
MSENPRDPKYLVSRSATELRELLFGGKVTVNDVRTALGYPPLKGGDAFYENKFEAVVNAGLGSH